MATRFYLPSSTSLGVAGPTAGAEWEHVNPTKPVRLMDTAKANTAFASLAYAPDAADHIADQDALFITYISRPLTSGQTISAQTINLTMICAEDNAGNNVFLTWKVYLCDYMMTTAGSTILAIRRDGTECATTLTNRTDSATSSSVTTANGDRIVLELGLGGLPVATSQVQGHNGTLRLGDNNASDLAANDTATTDANPWFEFATTTLTFRSSASLAFPSAQRINRFWQRRIVR